MSAFRGVARFQNEWSARLTHVLIKWMQSPEVPSGIGSEPAANEAAQRRTACACNKLVRSLPPSRAHIARCTVGWGLGCVAAYRINPTRWRTLLVSSQPLGDFTPVLIHLS